MNKRTCGNCYWHSYDWFDDGDEFDVCIKGNQIGTMPCKDYLDFDKGDNSDLEILSEAVQKVLEDYYAQIEKLLIPLKEHGCVSCGNKVMTEFTVAFQEDIPLDKLLYVQCNKCGQKYYENL